MSKFLGPVHHWLFNKTKAYEALEYHIIKKVEEALNVDLTETMENLENEIGPRIENRPLEELIDIDNIHGWLQNKINIAETRQAALITHIIKEYGEKAICIIEDCYNNQGLNSGNDAKDQYDVSNAPSIYKALNNYMLDGMPCDHVNNITLNEETKLNWEVRNCLHINYWLNVEADIEFLYKLRKIWISGFINAANPAYTYKFSKDDHILKHEISKK